MTGVQTCALPIWGRGQRSMVSCRDRGSELRLFKLKENLKVPGPQTCLV